MKLKITYWERLSDMEVFLLAEVSIIDPTDHRLRNLKWEEGRLYRVTEI